MSIRIDLHDPSAPELRALLAERRAWLATLAPIAEEADAALMAPGTRFFVARDDDAILGSAALIDQGRYGELKAMFVGHEARGRGVGAALLARIEAEARALGLPRLCLETDPALPLAHRLYARAGFTLRGPFGDYPEAPNSLFLEKLLMSFTIAPADPLAPGPAALLAAAQALQAEIYPPENNFSLPTAALAAPEIRFLAATEGDLVLGVGALKVAGGYGEVKSMFTAPEARGRGVAEAILAALEALARAEGLTAMKLETGDELAAAVRLYERVGFSRCGPFGDYEDNGSSVFMQKPLG